MSTDKEEMIFVYGTLKRGQIREAAWPRKPVTVHQAMVLGELYDLGEYPALIHGSDRIVGEVWRIAKADVPETLGVLDRIEGCFGGPDDLYERVLRPCWLIEHNDVSFTVQTYLYRDHSELGDCNRVRAKEDGYVRWP